MTRTYSNPPIIEAIFDIKVDNIGKVSISDFQAIHDTIRVDFPKIKKKIDFKGRFDFIDENISAGIPESRVSGIIFLSDDETRQIQFRLDGYTLNILKPYNSWEEHFDQFIKYWLIYQSIVTPKIVSRIATRFINKFEIPTEKNITDFLSYLPQTPKVLSSNLLDFFIRVTIPTDDYKRKAIIVTASEPMRVFSTPIILDIDVYQDEEINWEKIENLMSEFKELRTLKNKIFEGSITPKTRKMFDYV